MRVAVLGQGSMGRRHARLLLELGHEVAAYDPAPREAPDPRVRVAADVGDALRGAEAAVVATPPSEHVAQARTALEAGLHVLVEKPLAPSLDGVDELIGRARASGRVAGVAMNLRHLPGPRTLRRLLGEGAIGTPLRASVWCGSWLPGWRPGTDYRTTYSARRALGGGVLLDAIHELDYLAWLLGPAREAFAALPRVSDLELDVEDVAALELTLASGAHATVTLDYLDRAYHRGCRIVGAQGTLHWSWEDEEVVVHTPAGRAVHPAPADVEAAYRDQLETFLRAAAAGGAPGTALEEARDALALVEAARRSAETGRRVAVQTV